MTLISLAFAMSRSNDLACLLRSLQLIAEASIKLQEETLRSICRNSTIVPLIKNCKISTRRDQKNLLDVGDIARESAERFSTVIHGLKVYNDSFSLRDTTVSSFSVATKKDEITVKDEEDIEKRKPEFQIELTESDKILLERLDMEHRAKLVKQAEASKYEDNIEIKGTANINQVMSVPNPKSKQKLSEHAKQRTVPSSRIGRMVSFGALAAGLGLGTATEYAKRTLGIGDTPSDASNLLMSKANMERIVDTLCKVRGAALKLGQILSIQDESIISPELANALERVRKSADFMPNWQVEKMMSAELGPMWKENLAEFEGKPFAAASIGQVHNAKLKDGKEVAIKIQYPGVAKGIESDINNLGGIMKMWNIFPKGMFLENLMTVAKRELAWEVDYEREAACTKKFKEILMPYPDYYVPTVIDELSTKQVFTTELLDGIPVDQCFNLDLEHREFIADKIMELCLMEIMKFRYMQTDPNWANFLYNPAKKQLLLLDFGASREYSKEFMDKYVKILKGACDGDRDVVLSVSRDLGMLTGYESKLMEEAHVDAVMMLGEVFRENGKYDFGNQNVTVRIQNLAQIMLTHRLCPPPEEIYSLHRKLSGVFLLCAKLKVCLACRNKFLSLYDEYIERS